MRQSRRNIYRGEELAKIAFPLGGIGAGSVALCGDGRLREWQIFNRVNPEAALPFSFFGLWWRCAGQPPRFRLLQTVPIGSLPTVDETQFVGEFPVAQLLFKDRDLPVEASLEAFSPFIPLNARESALPAAIFILHVRNRSRRAVELAFVASLQNAVGYDGMKAVRGFSGEDFGGNVSRVVRKKTLTAIHMTNQNLEPGSPSFGTMTLSTNFTEASCLPQWSNLQDFWNGLFPVGAFVRAAKPAPSEKGQSHSGAIALHTRLRPGEQKSLPVVITWHFPNRFVFWDSWWDREAKGQRLGNMYNNWFADSLAVAQHIFANFDRLCDQTRLFKHTLFDTDLPLPLVDAVSSQISTLCAPTCMWLEDGTFAAFEGAGCCPLNCTHVWNYEQTLAHLFPELERNMRETDLLHQLSPEGYIPHRTTVPLSRPRPWGVEIGGPPNPAADGHLGTILKAYREHLRSSDSDWVSRVWPKVKLATEYALANYDPDGDGVITGEQPNTYDIHVYGANTFIGTLWLAALRAAEEMARIQGDTDFARVCRERFENGRQKMDGDLFNGEYFVQIYDEQRYPRHQWGTGCLSDQLLGQWWAHILNLGYLLPEQHVRRALRSIFKHNWRADLTDFVHFQRVFAYGDEKGLLTCTWPRGGRPNEPILYCDEVWTGIEYQVASHMLYEGMLEPGLTIAQGARERYDGSSRNPWNEIECGDHYARAMSSWGLLLAAEGYHYDGPAGILAFDPRITPERFSAFFSTAEGWGTFSQRRTDGTQRNTLSIRYGSLKLKELRLAVPMQCHPERCRARLALAGKSVKVDVQPSEGWVRFVFVTPLRIRAGESVNVTIVPA